MQSVLTSVLTFTKNIEIQKLVVIDVIKGYSRISLLPESDVPEGRRLLALNAWTFNP